MKSRGLAVPREHGFWVMLTAVLVCVLMQSARLTLPLVVTTLLIAVAIALVGGAVRRRIRRSTAAQLASAALLAAAGVPVALVAGLPASRIGSTTLAWVVIFVANALIVHASFARAARRTRRSFTFAALSIGATATASVGFSLHAQSSAALATAIAAFGCAAIALVAPTTRQLKPVGIALAGVATLAAFALAA